MLPGVEQDYWNAASNGDVESVRAILIDHPSVINLRNNNGSTTLHWAASRADEPMVALLLSGGAEVNAEDWSGMTPLHWAASIQRIVQLLISHGADVNAKSTHSKTPLDVASQNDVAGTHESLRKNSIESQYLLYKHGGKRGAEIPWLLRDKIRVELNFPSTELHDAALKGDETALVCLLIHGADPNAKNRRGQTPLHLASSIGHIAAVESLIERGANIHAQSRCGRTALFEASINGHNAIVKLLLYKGSNVNMSTSCGWSSLHAAAFNGHLKVIEMLLQNDADVNLRDSGDCTALHCAIENNHFKIAETLLSSGANPDADGILDSPLHLAAKMGRLELAVLLIRHGAEINADCDSQETPLDIATKYGQAAMCDVLHKKGALTKQALDTMVKTQDVFQAVSLSAFRVLEEIAKSNPLKLNLKGAYRNETPLHFALRSKKERIACRMIELGADFQLRDEELSTPLHLAARNGLNNAVKMLLAKGAEINARDVVGWTPLYRAACKEHNDVALALIAMNADVNARDNSGMTALHEAARGNPELVKILLDNGAEVNVLTIHGETPLDYANGWAVELIRNSGGRTGEELQAC